MKITQEDARRLVSKGIVYFTEPPKRIPSDTVVDTPLLGNGDFGAAIAGDGAKQVFYLGKNDFWSLAHLGETEQQRMDRLLHKEGRRSGTRIRAAGWMELEIQDLKGASYHVEQDPYLAEVRGRFFREEYALECTSFLCARQNTLMVELKNTGSRPFEVHGSTMAGIYQTDEIFGYEAGVREESVWFDYPADYHDLPGRHWVYASMSCDIPARYTPEKMNRKGMYFCLSPGESAHVAISMLSNLDSPDAKEEAYRMTQEARTSWDRLSRQHRGWWSEYWQRSLVSTGNDTLDRFYYLSLYFLASAVREGKTPPGLFGPWITTDYPKWTGSYTLNYNYESPFFPLYTSNRGDLARSYIEPLLDIIPIGRVYAREKYGRPGICLPVEIGPWGTVCSSLFHHQKTNAAYCCCNIFMYYFSTLDEEWGRRAYSFVREVADFWEADLVWEPDQDRYSVVGDSLHEVYYREGGEKNNTHALGLVRMVMKGILEMSEDLGLDEEKREKWNHILTHIAEFPVFERNGQTVFRFNEDNYAWHDGANGSSVKFIYPFGCIGLESDPKLLEIAQNTLIQKDLFDNGNAFCEYTVMCARVGIDPRLLYEKLIWQCGLRSLANGYIWHGGGGIEDCAGVTSGINEMMLQSHEGILRIFPDWVPDVDASFYRLRAYGAFLISSSISKNIVEEIVVESEKGRDFVLDLPWPKARVFKNGIEQGLLTEHRVRISTETGDVYSFTAE